MMRSKALRSTTRSLTTGKARERQGSISSRSPSLKVRMWSWQVAVRALGPWATPLIIMPQEPQIPSRQSWSKATGSSPRSISRSLSTSSISRNEACSLTSSTCVVDEPPRGLPVRLAPDPQAELHYL